MKKIRFDNVVQVKYFNKDDVIKKDKRSTFFFRIRNMLFFILACLFLYHFYRT